MAVTDGDRAIIAAIEILRDRITQLPLAIAQNAALAAEDASRRQAAPTAQPATSGRISGALTKIGTAGEALVSSFGRLFLPLAALTTYLGASTSGFEVFTSALKVFATAVAPVVLPAFVLFATALIAGSDAIFRNLLPALDGFFRLVLQTGIPGIISFVDALGKATAALSALSQTRAGHALIAGSSLWSTAESAQPGSAEKIAGAGSPLFALLNMSGPAPGEAGAPGTPGTPGSPGAPGAPGAPGSPGRLTSTAMSDVMKELLLSAGPKASSGSVSSIFSRGQLAVLNQSPFEIRMQDMMRTVVGIMTRAASETDPGVYTERGAAKARRRPRAGGA